MNLVEVYSISISINNGGEHIYSSGMYFSYPTKDDILREMLNLRESVKQKYKNDLVAKVNKFYILDTFKTLKDKTKGENEMVEYKVAYTVNNQYEVHDIVKSSMNKADLLKNLKEYATENEELHTYNGYIVKTEDITHIKVLTKEGNNNE